MAGELSILISILTVVLRGFGLGPTVMLEVLEEPDCTALITGDEVLAIPTSEMASGIVTSKMIVNAAIIRFFGFSFFTIQYFVEC